MPILCLDYYWSHGVPKGNSIALENAPEAYKIVDDPYHKRYSVERYRKGRFVEVIYDSALLDFRHLKPAAQQGWQREEITRTDTTIECLLRNQEDRVVFLEKHTFETHLCRKCEVFSPYNMLCSVHQMHYTALGDEWNGVILWDRNQHPVMVKRYQSLESGEFGELLEEQWELKGGHRP